MLAFVLFGVFLLPLAIYVVGGAVFGDYAGAGIGGFYGNLQDELREGEPVVVLLLLSPYIIWLCLRLTIWGFRHSRAKGRSAEI